MRMPEQQSPLRPSRQRPPRPRSRAVPHAATAQDPGPVTVQVVPVPDAPELLACPHCHGPLDWAGAAHGVAVPGVPALLPGPRRDRALHRAAGARPAGPAVRPPVRLVLLVLPRVHPVRLRPDRHVGGPGPPPGPRPAGPARRAGPRGVDRPRVEPARTCWPAPTSARSTAWTSRSASCGAAEPWSAAGAGAVPLYLASAEALPFQDATFDAVLHIGGINFFDDKAQALAEMARVAKPGHPRRGRRRERTRRPRLRAHPARLPRHVPAGTPTRERPPGRRPRRHARGHGVGRLARLVLLPRVRHP